MPAFDHSVLTDVGWDAMASCLAGQKLAFVHMEAGDGTITNGDAEMEGMTALVNKVMDITITSWSDDGEGQLTLIGTLSSKNVVTAFYFRELGVKCTLDGGAEILYSVANSGDQADYIPSRDETAIIVDTIEVVIKIDREAMENITIVIAADANVTAQNIGPVTVGAGWFRDKQGSILYFKRFVSTTNVRITETEDTVEANVVFPIFLPIGGIIDFGGSTIPAGFLLCDGSAVSRNTYANLFAELGTKWGVGDGSTTFNIPDLRSRVTIGAGQGGGLSNRLLGQYGGEEVHYVTVAEMPYHSHGANGSQPAHTHYLYDPTHNHVFSDPLHQHPTYDPTHTHSHADPGHGHGVYDPSHVHPMNSYPAQGQAGTGFRSILELDYPYTHTYYARADIGIYGSGVGTWSTGSYTGVVANWTGTRCWNNPSYTGQYLDWAGGEAVTISIANTGGSQAHNNMQPFAVLNKIIKT